MEWFLNEFETFVGVNFWTMLFAWCNLLILYFVLKKFLFVPIKNMIDSRQKEVDDMYSDAEVAREEAIGLKGEYESRLESAKEESEEILKNAHRRATLKEEEILREAKDEAARIIERAEAECELNRGGTYIKAQGLYTRNDKEMIFLVVNRKEVRNVQHKIKEFDPRAFVVVTDAYDTFGEGFKPFPQEDGMPTE